jgi:hypothetical protein
MLFRQDMYFFTYNLHRHLLNVYVFVEPVHGIALRNVDLAVTLKRVKNFAQCLIRSQECQPEWRPFQDPLKEIL